MLTLLSALLPLVNFAFATQPSSQLDLVHVVLEVLSEQLEGFLFFLQDLRFELPCFFLSDEPLQLELKDQVNGLLLFSAKRVRCTYFFDYIVILSDDDGDLVSLVSVGTAPPALPFLFAKQLSPVLFAIGVSALSSKALVGSHLVLSQKLFGVLQNLSF